LNHYYISRSWLISTKALRIYRFAAACSLLLIMALVTFNVEGETFIQECRDVETNRRGAPAMPKAEAQQIESWLEKAAG